MTTRSFWMIDDPAPLSVPEASTSPVDVVVIGGGLAGWSSAYWLRRRGIDAIVVDPDPAPAGASARNAGFLMTGTAFSYRESIRMWGREEARRLEQVSWDNRERLAELILSKHDCDASRTGTWRLAESEDEQVEMGESLRLLTEDGFAYEWVEPSDARALGQRFRGGLAQAGDWCLHPRKLVRALARESGSPRIMGTVSRFRSASGGVTVELTGGQEIQAGRVVVTLNGYASSVLGESPGIRPVRAQVLVTEPLDRTVWVRPVYSHYGYFYFRQLRDGRLLVGGARHLYEEDEVGLEDLTTDRLQDELERFLASIVEGAPAVEYRWSGVMGFTEDSRPVVSRIDDDPAVLLLGGFNGHGVGLAFESARQLVETEF